MLRLMKHTAKDSRRMVLRNDMGKVRVSALQLPHPHQHNSVSHIARGRAKTQCFHEIYTSPCSEQVLLNAAVYEGMGVTKAKNMIKFVANVEGDGPTTFMVKVTAEEIDDLHARVLGLVPSS